MRPVRLSDADFIFSLRTNQYLSRHLNKATSSVEDQVKWISEYKKRETEQKEIYYLIEDGNQMRYGTYRIYNIVGAEATFGSWLMQQDAPPFLAIKSDLLIKDFIFVQLKIETLYFDVRKKNKRVLSYHKFFDPILYNEDQLNFYYRMNKMHFLKGKEEIKNFFQFSL